MRARRRHTKHGPRRHWYAPWTVTCRCGIGAWPCYAVQLRDRQRGMQPRPQENTWAVRSGVALRLPRTAEPTDTPLLTPGQAYRSSGRTR